MGKVGLSNKFLPLFPKTKKQPALLEDRLLSCLKKLQINGGAPGRRVFDGQYYG